MLRSTLPLCVALALTAGCGSTVPLASRDTARLAPGAEQVLASGDGLGAPSATGSDGTPGSVGSPVEPGTTASADLGKSTETRGGTGTGSSNGSVQGSSGTASGSGSTTSGGAAAVADRTPIRVGIFYLDGGNQALSSGFGDTPVNFGDGRLEARAVVEDINKNGGVGGRKIEAFYQPVQAQNANGAGLEAACRGLIEDHKVSVIASMFNVRSQLVACAHKGGAILLDVALGAGDNDLYQKFADTLYTPTQLNLDSEQRLVITEAVQTGRLKKSDKVGVLIQQDDETFQRVYDSTMKPVLREAGIPVQSSTIATAMSSGDYSAAVLRFKSDGVTHVMFSVGNGGIPPVFFMQAAENQAYRPKYLMGDSTNTWFVGDSAARSQVQNITGAGTYPIANVDAGQYPTTPREKKCLDVITAAGQRVADRHSSLTATFYCEMLYGFSAIGATVKGPITKASFRQAYYAMGTNYPAITTFRSNLSNGRNDNPAAYRLLGWKSSCSCISYLSPERPLPF
jgi:ABC-type branched-subunit amino acid transport system substrate-binding protein